MYFWYPPPSARLILCTWRPFQQAIYFFLSWAGVTTTLIPVLLTAEIGWINLTYSSKFVCANIPLPSASAFDRGVHIHMKLAVYEMSD